MEKLVIFDLDGTLVNSIEDIADAANKVLKDNGLRTFEISEYYSFIGNGARTLITQVLDKENQSDENIDRLLMAFSKYYSENVCNKTKAYDGIKDVLTKLKSNGIKLAVASNKPHEHTECIVKKIFGENTFDYITGNKAGLPHKPDPYIINVIMKLFNVSSNEVVLIGDSDVDIKAGKNASVMTIGCKWGFRTEKELIKAGADFVVDVPCEILDIIFNKGERV